MGQLWFSIFYEYRYFFYVGFAIYTVWDWFRTQKIHRKREIEGAVFGFQRATLAWALKIFVVYWLIWVIPMNLQVIQNSISDGVSFFQNGIGGRIESLSFDSRYVVTDIKPLQSTQNDDPISIYVIKGFINCQNEMASWLRVVFTIFAGILGIAILVLLLLIIRPIAQKKPFTVQNVNRFRLLAILVLLQKSSEWLNDTINNWIVTQHFSFPSLQEISIHFNDYPVYIILCLGLIIFAEIIQSASELKDDADLTV